MRDMNQNIYKDAMNTMCAPKELVNKVKKLDSGVAQEKRKNNRQCYRKIAVAAAVVFFMALVIPNTSVASYVKEIFSGFWGSQNEVDSFVKNGGYVDNDKHIKVSVEEVLSDGVCVQAVVKYTAKDEKGIKWLKDYKPKSNAETGSSFKGELCIEPDFYHGNGVSGAYSYEELEEYKSDKERYFAVQYLANEPMKKCILHYALVSGPKEMELDINCNVPVYRYNLKAEGEEKISRFYEPLKIRISRLSIIAFGKDTGIFAEYSDEFTSAFSKEYMEEYYKENFRSVKIIKKDGSKTELDFIGAYLGGIGKKAMEENKGCDCLVFSQNLCHLDYNLNENGKLEINPSITNIQPEEITGIELENERKKVIYWFE